MSCESFLKNLSRLIIGKVICHNTFINQYIEEAELSVGFLCLLLMFQLIFQFVAQTLRSLDSTSPVFFTLE